MSDGTIDNLVVEVTSTASASVREINSLADALGALGTKSGSTATKVNSVATSVTSLKQAVNELNVDGLLRLNDLKISKASVNNLSSLSTALEQLPTDSASKLSGLSSLSELSNVKISSTIPSNITKLATAVSELPEGSISRITGLTSALLPLKEVSGLKLTGLLNTLKQLPEVLATYDTLDVEHLTKQLDTLIPRLTSLATATQSLKSAYNGLPASLRTTASAARTVASANKTLSTSNTTLVSALTKLKLKLAALTPLFFKLYQGLSKCISTVNDYIENMNLFEASMGDATESALEYAESVQNLMGIDMGEWVRNQGVFQTLITGMGQTSEAADVMSQQLTQLGYDISSFYNIDVDDAMTKLQSGIAGELEPLRRLGWDLSNARMQLELTNMGIDENVTQMTQAEKVALRYYLIMNQVTTVHGDMARTIQSPANQLRVLQAQLTLAARAIGDLFIPMLNTVLPYVIGLAKAVRLLAIEIANLFGVDATFEVDYSSLDTSGIASASDDLSDMADEATDAEDAVEALKNSVMGFDELNKLASPTTSSSSSSGDDSTEGVGLDLPIDTYDFLDGLDTYITDLSDSIAENLAGALKVILPIVSAIGVGILAWKLLNFIDDLKTSASLAEKLGTKTLGIGKKLSIVIGIAMAVAGAIVTVYNAWDAWNNGVTQSNMLGIFGGLAVAVTGMTVAFGSVAGAVTGAIGGVIAFAVGVKDIYENGLNASNAITTLGGAALVIGGLAVAFGGVGAIIGVVALAVAGLGVAIYEFSQPSIEHIDALGDVSEETAARFGTSIDSMEAAEQQLKENDFASCAVSEEDVATISERVSDVKNTILDNLSTDRNNELANIDSLSGVVPEETLQRMRDSVNNHYDTLVSDTESWASQIGEIYSNAATEHRDLTEDEVTKVSEMQNNLKTTLIETSGATAEEMQSIQQAMASNQESTAVEAASAVIQKAIETRDSTVAAAWDTYRAQMSAADGALEAGAITQEEYDAIAQAAEQTRDTTVQAANDTYYGGDGVVAKVEEGLGDAKNKIDTNTGEIKSNWDVFCDDLSSGWSGLCDSVGSWWSEKCSEISTNWDRSMSDASTAFDRAGENFEQTKETMGENLSNLGQSFSEWKDGVGEKLSNLGESFSEWKDGVGEKLNTLKGKFSDWKDNVGTIFSNLWTGISDGFKNFINDKLIGKINSFILKMQAGINSIIDVFNSVFQFDLPDWLQNLTGFSHIGFSIPHVASVYQIPYLATGGQVTSGQMFVARENGTPEMVGRMGNKTTVANNEQIVEGIEAGVVNAMLQVLPAFQSNGQDGDVTLVLQVGNEELARATNKGNASLVRRGQVKTQMVFA